MKLLSQHKQRLENIINGLDHAHTSEEIQRLQDQLHEIDELYKDAKFDDPEHEHGNGILSDLLFQAHEKARELVEQEEL